MTPREVLQFSAKLRLTHNSGESDESLIEDLLQSMSLSKCADTMVGNELIKGISGGERKRTAVGAELITNPEITFLDEPTSGLDTGAAYDVITLLKQLASMNRSVLCTIHQPSSEIFQLFDQAIFLVGGEVAYHGPPSGIRSHFSAIGLNCPEDSGACGGGGQLGGSLGRVIHGGRRNGLDLQEGVPELVKADALRTLYRKRTHGSVA